MQKLAARTVVERELELIEKISTFRDLYGYSPSYSQLGVLMHLSKTRIAHIVEVLVIKKLLAKDGSKARTLRVLC